MGQKFKFTRDIPAQIYANLMKGGIPAIQKMFKYAPIDVVSLFDKVFLHEVCRRLERPYSSYRLTAIQLTHAHASGTRVTEDIGGWNSYGKEERSKGLKILF